MNAMPDPISEEESLSDIPVAEEREEMGDGSAQFDDGDEDMLGYVFIPDPRLDGRDMMSGKRLVCDIDEDYSAPMAKVQKIIFPSSTFGNVMSYGNTQSSFGIPSTIGSSHPSGSSQSTGSGHGFDSTPLDFMSRSLSFQFTTNPALSSQIVSSTPSEDVRRRFVPSWNFAVVDDRRSVESVGDYLDHMVPPKRVAESQTQSTTYLVDSADLDLFNGVMGYAPARKRVTMDHDRLKDVCVELRVNLGKTEENLKSEKSARLGVENKLTNAMTKIVEYEKELVEIKENKKELVEGYENKLAKHAVDVTEAKKDLDLEQQTSNTLRTQLDAAVQSKKDLIVALPNLFKCVLKHNVVM